MTQMESVCKDMKQRLVNAESQTADMIEQANMMQEHGYILNCIAIVICLFTSFP